MLGVWESVACRCVWVLFSLEHQYHVVVGMFLWSNEPLYQLVKLNISLCDTWSL